LSFVEQYREAAKADGNLIFVPILIVIGERPDSKADETWKKVFDNRVYRLMQSSPAILNEIIDTEIESHPREMWNKLSIAVCIDSLSGIITEASGAATRGGMPADARQRIEACNALATKSIRQMRVVAIFNTPPEGAENWSSGISGACDITVGLQRTSQGKIEPSFVRCRVLNEIWDAGGHARRDGEDSLFFATGVTRS
jgi:hypothetical protein